MTTIRPFVDQGNYVAIHNSVFDVIMPALSPTAWKLLCFVIRETKGRRADERTLSYTALKRGTGIKSDTTIRAALETLRVNQYVCADADGRWEARTYRLNLNLTLTTSGHPTSDTTPKNDVVSTPKNGATPLQKMERHHSKKWSDTTPKNDVVSTPKNGDINKQVNKHTNREGDDHAPQAAAQPPPPPTDPYGQTTHARRLPTEMLPDQWRAYCATRRADLDPDAVWENFRDYWLGVPGQKGRKSNWTATWKRWVREEKSLPSVGIGARASPAPAQHKPTRDQTLWIVSQKRVAQDDTPSLYEALTRIEQRQHMTSRERERLIELGMPP